MNHNKGLQEGFPKRFGNPKNGKTLSPSPLTTPTPLTELHLHLQHTNTFNQPDPVGLKPKIKSFNSRNSNGDLQKSDLQMVDDPNDSHQEEHMKRTEIEDGEVAR